VTSPAISVVVATHDRPERLASLLAGLQAQSFGDFELVVVDDGSEPATAALLERWHGGLQLEVVRHASARGAGAARNAGWRAARAPLVAFTDDDCVPDPRWLEAGLAVWHERHGAVVQGRTLPESGRAAGVLSRTLRVERLGPQYETCNIFYPRELLEALGGFDEGFGLRPGGEDTDLAWRALEAGRMTVFAPQALVYHAVERMSVAAGLRAAARWSATVRIFGRHPAARTMLYRGIFWNVWHYLLLRSVLALLLPRRLRRIVLARHLMALRRRAIAVGSSGWAVPYLIAYDVVELAGVARGALRYRTLVL
jgi:GT2 family glycosyltransferase